MFFAFFVILLFPHEKSTTSGPFKTLLGLKSFIVKKRITQTPNIKAKKSFGQHV